MRHILFVFLDGVGLGSPHAHNPLAQDAFQAFRQLAGGQPWTSEATPLTTPGHLFKSIDANLGVEGLPQSGTGQATLFTGVNCAEVVGRHYGPFPHSATRPMLATDNVFRKVQALDLPDDEPAAFANAYPPRFFDYARQRDRWTVTTRCCLEADVPLRGEAELRTGHALAADLTSAGWQRLALDVPVISEAEAGRRLAALSQRHAFTLFEYYLTDKAGHGRLTDRSATDILQALDRFLAGLLDAFDPEQHLLLITSDHGNLEDLSTKSHTRNPVPLIAYGPRADHFQAVTDLTGVTPAIVDALAAA